MSDPRKQKRQRDQVIARALHNRDETREKLLAQGRKLARRRAENVERSRKRADDTSNSTNPTVHSTIPSVDSNAEATARHSHSTVPARPTGSTVPAADRLYGLRLYDRIRSDGEAGGGPVWECGSDTAGTVESGSDGDGGDGGDPR